MCANANDRDFSRRIGRIEMRHRDGSRHESGSVTDRPVPLHREGAFSRIVLKSFTVVVVVLMIKATLLFQLGPKTYADHVADVSIGTGFDFLLAPLLSADPLTRMIAYYLTRAFPT